MSDSKKGFSLKQKLHYRFDNVMSRGTIAIIAWLGIVSVLLILIGSFVIIFANVIPGGASSPPEFAEAIWQSLMRAMDPGSVAGDEGWAFRFVMLGVTIGGIFIVTILIGSVTSGIETKIDELRKGRSFVVESGHTLILGWSTKIMPVISELTIANENQRDPKIVILADKDKVEMEDEIRGKIEDTRNTRIICRNGSPLDLKDLEIVNPNDAKSIIVLAPNGENPDIHVIKTILAITNSPNRKKGKYHIVGEIEDEKNMEAATMVGGDEAILMLSEDLISRITVQTCRQSGLSVIYTELMDFDGDEIYFQSQPELVGKIFRDTIFAYEKSAIMGVRFRDGTIKINPPMETPFSEGDMVVAVSEDDDTVVLSGKQDFGINEDAIASKEEAEQKPEHTLVLGWNPKGNSIVKELDSYVVAGSTLTIIADSPYVEEELESVLNSVTNHKLEFIRGNTTHRKTLESLNLESFDHIIVLCYSRLYELQQSDAMTLITLLHLRDISDKHGTTLNIVSEMQDIGNKELAEVTKANDFIVSDKLISLMLSQLSENSELKAVFDDLLDADGSEIYLKPATDYIKPGIAVNFYTVLESASRKGEVALGYRQAEHFNDPRKDYGVVVNPLKSDMITFTDKDRIVVLAED